MRKIVVIHIDALRREYSSAWLLGEAFKKQGYSVFLTSRTSTDYFLRLIVPDILILSHPFVLPQEKIRNLKEKGTKIYVTEVEGIVRVDHDISATYPDYIQFSNFEKIFVWNDWSKVWLEKNRKVKPNQVIVSGCLRNDLIQHIQKKASNKKIGILGRFELINPFDGRHAFENLRYMEQRHIERWHVDLDSFLIVRDLTRFLIDNGYKVSFRPHPNEKISSYAIFKNFFGPSFEIDTNFDYYSWLQGLDKVVGTVSSAFLEPYLIGIPVVCIDQLFDYKGPPNLEEWRKRTREGSYVPNTFKDLEKLCLDSSLAPKRSKKLDSYIYELYQMKNVSKSDSLHSIVAVIAEENRLEPFRFRIPNLFSNFFRLILDVLVILRAQIQNKGAWTVNNIKQYDYNLFLHRPNDFMKKLKAEALD
ncbi:hypothetical protein JWG45_09185 [Leptospira sp. 201903070]|uniref:Surface carbohydrate biosynthesis protein n=1 Tax=Leptospira ainlahdjerensis TaxID=2810033 RepID=A0ABS2UBZ6_9LEPT|nr:hypothetical protein [Leptospira ainlahdjerensis]MBM9577324.1 hypothetical protein [Leptospira ainlahdjerensis]